MTATADLRTRQVRTAAIAAGAALAMAGLAYASVPLYRIFCQVTGFGGTTQRMEASAAPAAGEIRALGGKTIRVRFDGNVRSGLPWRFAPSQGPVEVKIGEQNLVYYRATSTHSAATTGSATFNVSPEAAGRYFAKVQCFCFNEQTLDAGQSAEMPVVFYVDPAILDDPDTRDISEITLSYSFFPVAAPGRSANGRPPGIYATGVSSIAQNSR